MEYPVTCMLSWKKITNLNYNIEKEVNSLFDEFLLLVTRNVYGTFHSSEVYEQEKVRGSSDSDTWKIISENHAFCYYCNEHLYSFTDIPDINSFFQKHINTNYHKSCRQIEELPDSQPMFTWEEFGVTGCCHVCNMSGLNALVFDTRTDIRGLRARHKCQSEMKYNKIDLLKRLCCLTLFLQKFSYKHKKGSLVCLLCNWKLNPDDTIMSHFASDHHMHNFLKFMHFTFKFETKDLLNGYHLELIFRWILAHDVVINSNEPPLNSTSRENCLLVSNSSNKLYRGIRNYIEFTPKLISEILSFNALDFIAENECLLCDQKDIQASHIHKPTHQKNLQDAHNFIKNSKNYTRYLENVANRLRPFRVEIECYYEYKNYLARVYPLLNKNTTPDRKDPVISQNQQSNSILNEVIDIIEQKNYISENKTVQKNDMGKDHSTDLSSSEPTNATQSIKPFNPDKTQIEKPLVSDKKKPIDLNAAVSKTKYDTSKGKKVQEEDEGSKVTPSVNSITERNEPNTSSMESTEKLPNGTKKKKKKRNKNSKGDKQQVSTTMAVNVNANLKVELDKVPQLGNSVKKLETVIKADKTDLSISLNEIDARIRDGLKLEVDDGTDTEKPKIVKKPAVNMDKNSLQMSNEASDIGGSSAQFDADKNNSKSGSNNSAPEKDKDNKPEKVPKKKKPKQKNSQISTTVSNPSQTKTFTELPRESEHHDSGGAIKKNASQPKKLDILHNEKPHKEDATSVTPEEKDKKTDKNVDGKKKPVSKKGETSKKGQNENEAVLMIPDLPKDLRDNIELYTLFRKFGKIKEVVIENGQGFLVFEDPETIQLALNSRPMKFNEFVLELVKTTRQDSLNKEEKMHPIFVYYLNYPEKLMDRIMKTVAWSSSPWYRENEIRREELLCRKIIATIKKSYPRSRCYPFGSRVTDLSLENSDLDVFLDSGDAYEGSDNLSRKVNIVKLARNIWSLLKNNKVAFSQFNIVTRARIPIVSFVENETNLKCDLSFSNGLSVQNTVMVKFMLSLDWRVRPLILMVKHWALLNQLHGRPFFSSYALSLMTIFYLQQISSPILPAIETLQKNFTGRRYTINGWDCNICTKMNLLPKVTNSDSVLVLLMGFFEFYEKFRYDKFIISPLTGIPLSREALTTKFTSLPMAYKRHYHNMPLHIIQNMDTYIWCVDPFDLSHNVTSQFPGKEFKMFIKFCKASVEHLKKGLETEAFKVPEKRFVMTKGADITSTRGCN